MAGDVFAVADLSAVDDAEAGGLSLGGEDSREQKDDQGGAEHWATVPLTIAAGQGQHANPGRARLSWTAVQFG
jgi:hypothetical protein